MKKIKSALALLCAMILMASCCVSCGGGNDEIKGFDISSYTVVRPSRASSDLISHTTTFKNMIKTSIGVELSVKEDWVPPTETLDESGNEILVGETNRTASANSKAKLSESDDENAFIIEIVGNKIVILGKTDEITVHALKYFLVNFVRTSKQEGKVAIDENYSQISTADTETLLFDNFVQFKMSDIVSIYKPESQWALTTYQYPKILQLQYQEKEENNGILFSILNSSEHFYRLFRSYDNGDNWKQVTQIYDKINKGVRGGRMGTLYELPVDIGEFKKGTIILAGTSSALDTHPEKTAIVLYYSTDLGETWKTYQSIDFAKGRTNGEGIWEPFLIYEEETERIYCFYSDDSDPEHDQKLVYKYTTDFKNWVGADGKIGADEAPCEAVACDDPKLRPGMISIAKMGNGEYIMTYEMVGLKMNPTYAKRTKRLDDWGDVSDYGTIVQSTDGVIFGSSPWCAWSPVGGECGTLIVVGKHRSDNPDDKTAPDMFVSFDYGETYIGIDNPIDYTISSENRCGYSPGLFFSSDGRTLYYVNNPNYGPGNEYIAFRRIEIIE